MNSLIGLYANASGLWGRINAVLPLLAALGSILEGLAGYCVEFSKCTNAVMFLGVLHGLATDQNTALVGAGWVIISMHLNHAAMATKQNP